jgi:dolichol-phosphate mannosyltransferase
MPRGAGDAPRRLNAVKLAVLIPAHNEAVNLPDTVQAFYSALAQEGVEHEILVVDDNSSDNTIEVLEALKSEIPSLRYVTNPPPRNGFGYAVRKGLETFEADSVAIVMADLSDDPHDLIRYFRAMVQGNYDCVFGSRFIKGGKTIGYPRNKLILNRLANNFVRLIFGLQYNDCTNAFKLYRRETILGLQPFLSPHFNLTLELPLKAIVRGYSYTVLPNSWRNRTSGASKFRIREMGSRYFFVLLYCLIERYFSKGDFRKRWN